MEPDEPFSNPVAPAGDGAGAASRQPSQAAPDRRHLSNADFRQLLLMPRTVGGGVGGCAGEAAPASARPLSRAAERKKTTNRTSAGKPSDENDALVQLSRRYRDRAKERRENAKPDYWTDQVQAVATGAGGGRVAYGRVAPAEGSAAEAAERRRQLIEQSKFLGGDLAHTHLVRGLDLALLQKVKAERLDREDAQLELVTASRERLCSERPACAADDERSSPFAQSVLSAALGRQRPQRIDLFQAGRMAFVFDLDQNAASAFPTAVIRSKADCPDCAPAAGQSPNEIVIGKLTSILALLRQTGRRRHKQPAPADLAASIAPKPGSPSSQPDEPPKRVLNDLDIYDGIGKYELPTKRVRPF